MFDFFMFYMYVTFALVVLALVGFMAATLKKEPSVGTKNKKRGKRSKKG